MDGSKLEALYFQAIALCARSQQALIAASQHVTHPGMITQGMLQQFQEDAFNIEMLMLDLQTARSRAMEISKMLRKVEASPKCL